MNHPKTYWLLIFLPYLFLVVIFHLHLQMPPQHAVSRDPEDDDYDDKPPLIVSPIRRAQAQSELDKDSFHFRDLMIKDNNGDAYALRGDYERPPANRSTGSLPKDATDHSRPTLSTRSDDGSSVVRLIKVSRTFQNGTRQIREMVRRLDRDLRRLELDGASETMNLSQNEAPFGTDVDSGRDADIRWPLNGECLRRLKSVGDGAVDDTNAFRHVGGGAHVVSAYLDSRLDHQPPFVRMIAIMSRGRKPELYCHFPTDDAADGPRAGRYATELALFYEMCENHNKEQGGWIISCKVPSAFTDADRLPCRVVVSELPSHDGRSPSGVSFPIYTTSGVDGASSTAAPAISFGVCVPPLFGHIPSTTLVEFVELSLLLGAGHLVFYVHRVTVAMRKVLEYYQRRGSVTVVGWELPVADNDIWYHGQLVAINDCLYRTMHRFSHVVFNDVDEFLIPHRHDTWHGLVRHLEGDAGNRTANGSQLAGFSFQSAFFDPLVNGDGKILYDLESDLRTKIFSQVRTKVMVRPKRIFELGIHHISRPLLERYARQTIEPALAFIHHYRKCMTDFDPRMKCQVYARDESISRYIPSLRHNVHETLWILKEQDEMSRRP